MPIFRRWWLALAVPVLWGPVLWGQTTATITGRITAPGGGAVEAAQVTLEHALTGFRQEVTSSAAGEFQIGNLPFQEYVLQVAKPGFASVRRAVPLRSNVPVEITIPLVLSSMEERISVSAYETAELVDPQATGTHMALSATTIQRMPVSIGNRGLEAVLLSFPGFAQNANGAIHPRGAHNQMTYVVDGLPISDQLTGAFASSLDASIVQSLELFTGNIPAEYGNKVSGVVNIITRSGVGSGRRFTGSTRTSAAIFDTLSNLTEMGGERGKWGYFASFFTLKSHRYLDQVSRDNLRNGGNSERGYGRLDYQLSSRDVLRFHLMGGRSSFELANLRSQQAAGQKQRQELRDASFWMGWVHTLNARTTVDSTAAYRTTISQLFPSAGDTPVTAAQARHLSTLTVSNHVNAIAGRHMLRGGVDFQHFPVSENFTFGITDPAFNDPAGEGYRPTLLPHDLSRGGRLFAFSKKAAGKLTSGFLQDHVKYGRLVLSAGLRYDDYRFLVQGRQLQPRVGVAYHLPRTGTVLRASYNRTYQTPPNENLLLSNSVEASRLTPASVRTALGQAFAPIRPERQNVYEAGVQQSVGGRVSVNASFYHKDARDQQDNDNFLNTGIIFPVTLRAIRVNGAELRLAVPPVRGLSGSLSLTHARAVSTPPFTGGLFLSEGAVDLLTSGPFVIDHDQKLGAQGNVLFTSRRHVWLSGAVRYDSGLVANPSDPAQVAGDPDYADLLDFVNLASTPARVRPRTIVDVAAGYERVVEGRRRWEVQFQVANLGNRAALYNFQSVFVGTRLAPPRTAGLKLLWYW